MAIRVIENVGTTGVVHTDIPTLYNPSDKEEVTGSMGEELMDEPEEISSDIQLLVGSSAVLDPGAVPPGFRLRPYRVRW